MLGNKSLAIASIWALAACGALDKKKADSNGGPSGPDAFSENVQPVMQKNCYGCHGANGTAFFLGDETSVRNNAKVIAAALNANKMPPAKSGISLNPNDKTTIINFVNSVH